METHLTFVMCVYDQPVMMAKWFETLRTYPKAVLSRIRLIVVDDCGKTPQDVPRDIWEMMDVRLYRVDKDIPWNQPGGRNLAMQECSTDWALMLDPDMLVEPEQARLLLGRTKTMRRGEIVRILLRYTNGVYDNSSPNAYLIHRKDFDAVKGYSESYAGHKGWSDVELLHTLAGVGMKFLPPGDLWVRYYQTRDIEDAMVRSLPRSVAFNRKLHVKRMAAAKRDWAAWIRNRGKRIRFPWTRAL